MSYFFIDKNNISGLISYLIAIQYYNIPLENYLSNVAIDTAKYFHSVDCDINNKIEIKELINDFKGESWEANQYNIWTNNCQIFAVQIIEILKAVRKKEKDKIRTYEKIALSNCIINALWHNEKLSLINSLGRIPIFGIFIDISLLIRGKG